MAFSIFISSLREKLVEMEGKRFWGDNLRCLLKASSLIARAKKGQQ